MASFKVKGPGKAVLVILLLVGAFFGIRYYNENFTTPVTHETKKLSSIDLPEAPKNAQSIVKQIDFPSDATAVLSSRKVKYDIMAWNSQMGLIFANGGIQTTKGSLMEKYGVNLELVRQDDCGKMQQDLIKFANAYKNDPNTSEGIQYVSIMGDGAAAFLAGINPELQKLGPDYIAEIVYSHGKSLGEDKLMGPQAWKDNPKNAIGGTVCAYLRDGDWNIAVKWAADNGIPVNPDEKTYDPNALNFIAANDFLEAADKYNTGYTEERKVVVNGKVTSDTKTVGVDAVATWTPGDVRIAVEGKGGLVSIVSTYEYRSQMPNVMIGIKKFNQDNPKIVEGIISASAEAGDQVKCYSTALNKAGELSAKVYNEKDGKYWVEYYKGIQKADKQGNVVPLGGSRVHSLSDNLQLFGIENGSANVYAAVYTRFGDVVKELYPTLVPEYPSINEVLNLSYLKNVASRTSTRTEADQVEFSHDEGIREVVAERDWTIEFEVGKATFTPQALKELETLYQDLIVASSLKVEIHGHTDNTGDPEKNMMLSEQRAFAIKEYLQKRASKQFPDDRVTIVAHGSMHPVASNNTIDGRAKNRRVEIKMGK